MSFIKHLGTVITLLLGLLSPAQGDSPVWKVTNGANQLYIGGTIHVLSQADYPLPVEFDQAYNQSAQLVLETDIEKLQNPEYLAELMGRLTYTDGRNLKQVVSDRTYRLLDSFLSARGIPIESILMFKPGLVISMLTAIELQRLGQAGTGVDTYFSIKARNEQKQLGQLETVYQQLDFIASMGEGEEDAFFIQTMIDMKRLPGILKSMKVAWRSGDNSKLEELVLIPLKQHSPKLYESLLVSRNNLWIPKIEAMLKTVEVEFVLVGALHLVGKDGLLQQLSNRGYTVEMQSRVQ